MQRIEGDDFTIAVHHGNGARSDQNHFRMAHGIFAAIRGTQRKRMKPAAGDSLANLFQIHAGKLSLPRRTVNRVGLG